VFETYQNWQRELERQPVELSAAARPRCWPKRAPAWGITFAPRPTIWCITPIPRWSFNMVARSLNLQPGDEVLGTDHEYPAMRHVWDYITRTTAPFSCNGRCPCR
jgi:isopenicillin-N epimerase